MKWVNTILVITDKEKFQAFLLQGKAFNFVTKNIVSSLRLVLLRVFSAVYVSTNQISKFLAAGPTFLLFLILIHSKTGVYLDLNKALFIERVTEPCCARSETIDIDILKTPSLCTFLFLKMIIFLPRTTTINIESSEELGVCSGCT